MNKTINTTNEALELRSHGRRSLELKLEHQLGKKSNPWFSTRILFFFPQSLAMSEDRLGRKRWYTNLRAYLRLHPPATELQEIGDETLYTKVRDAASSGYIRGEKKSKNLRRMFRLHAQRLRNAARQRAQAVVRTIEHQNQSSALENVNEFVLQLRHARKPLRHAGAEIMGSPQRSKLVRLISRCDEWTSLETSHYTLQIMHVLQKRNMTIPKACHDLLDTENTLRAARGYRSSTMNLPDDSSELLMRVSRLKKLMGSALYLDLSAEKPSTRVQDFAFAVAASVAMLWAVGAQLATWWYVGNPTQPDATPGTILAFAATAIVAYALKDRIKEGLRRWFRSRIPAWLFDRKQVGRDDGEELATAQESTTFLELAELDSKDLEWYQSSHPLDIPTNVISYQRTTHLKADRMREGQPDMAGLTEIIRFAVRPWLTHMDNLRQPIVFRDDQRAIQTIKAVRMYPVVVLIELDQPGATKQYSYRLYVSQRGLERIDRLDKEPRSPL